MFARFLPGTIRTFNHNSGTYLLYNDHLILKCVSVSSALPMKHLPVWLSWSAIEWSLQVDPSCSVCAHQAGLPRPIVHHAQCHLWGGGYKYLRMPSLSVITNNRQISLKLKPTLMLLVLLLLLPPDGGKAKVIHFPQLPILSNFPLNFPCFSSIRNFLRIFSNLKFPQTIILVIKVKIKVTTFRIKLISLSTIRMLRKKVKVWKTFWCIWPEWSSVQWGIRLTSTRADLVSFLRSEASLWCSGAP